MYITSFWSNFEEQLPQKNSCPEILKTRSSVPSHAPHCAAAGSHPKIPSTSHQTNLSPTSSRHNLGSGSASARIKSKRCKSAGAISNRRFFSTSTICRPFFSTILASTRFPGCRCPASLEVILRALFAFTTNLPNRFVKTERRTSRSPAGSRSKITASLRYSCTYRF